MLRFIIGTNEEARRSLLYQHIAEENSAYLIVPEQFSFESEKLLSERLGPAKAQNVEVLGFSRLCNSIFRTFGGIAGEYTDETAKLLIMGAALSACRDNLSYYKKNIHGAPFIKKLVETDSELKNAGVSSSDLLRLSEKGGTLGEKAADLSAVFELYDSMLEKSWLDPLSDIKRACEILFEHDFFGKKAVFIDNFTGFTGSEFKLLTAVIRQSPTVEISLCCDSVYDRTGGTGLFSKTQRTASRLERIAKENGVSVETPVFAETENDRRPAGIIDLEENFLRSSSPKGENKGEVVLISASDPYEEANFVAAKARQLAEEGYRWRDMAVIARSLSPYEHALPGAFEKAGVPLYLDRTSDLSAHPLSAFISASLSAVRGNFALADIMRILKTGIIAASEEEVAEFENYCFIWNIRGKLFLSPFTGNPEGFTERGEIDEEALLRINSLREKVIMPLEKLKTRLYSADGKEFSEALYDYLCECEVTEGLRRLYDGFAEKGEISEAEKLDSFWNCVVAALDKFSFALEGVRLEEGTLGKLFELVLAESKIGVLPQTLDCVSAGTADRMRPSDIKIVFILGLCDGIFPAPPSNGSLFTDEDRRVMQENGLDVSDGQNDALLSERMYAYTAFTSASEKVFALYHRYDIAAAEAAPSVLIRRLKEAVLPLEEKTVSSFGEELWLCSESFAFERLASFGKTSLPEGEAIRKHLSKKELWNDRAQKLGKPVLPSEFSITDPQNARKLFGERFRLSPSRIETYEQCPFSYFIGAGLMLKDRRKAELSPLSAGSLIHFALQKIIFAHGGSGISKLSDAELRAEIDAVLKAYLDDFMNSEKDKTARFMCLYRRIAGFLTRLIRRIGNEFAVSEFEPYAFEMPVKSGSEAGFYRLVTPDGIEISVEGIIDRVDVLNKNGSRYVRVVDYKSGSKTFELCDVFYGINIQMLVYLFSIWENGSGNLSGSTPAGVLYMPAKDSPSTMSRNAEPEKVAAELQKKFRMNGLLLDDPDVLNAMEPGLKGIFIPVSGKNGTYKGSVASIAELGKIKSHVDSLLIEMATELSEGRISALPYRKKDKTSCDWCSYKAVCRRSENEPMNEHLSFANDEFYKLVKGGEELG
ncbi:MAG: PD-(D/E)XK nuclease family protein [Oscillospiraceae bacterium]|nr:PD-(D/E)XK nuclease family protein [Oscillospiraceae bacterium]